MCREENENGKNDVQSRWPSFVEHDGGKQIANKKKTKMICFFEEKSSDSSTLWAKKRGKMEIKAKKCRCIFLIGFSSKVNLYEKKRIKISFR